MRINFSKIFLLLIFTFSLCSCISKSEHEKLQAEKADLLKSKLTEKLKVNFADITVSFDIFHEKDLLVIHLFWNRLSEEQWSNSKRFNCKIDDYLGFSKTEIIPFIEKQNA